MKAYTEEFIYVVELTNEDEDALIDVYYEWCHKTFPIDEWVYDDEHNFDILFKFKSAAHRDWFVLKWS